MSAVDVLFSHLVFQQLTGKLPRELLSPPRSLTSTTPTEIKINGKLFIKSRGIAIEQKGDEIWMQVMIPRTRNRTPTMLVIGFVSRKPALIYNNKAFGRNTDLKVNITEQAIEGPASTLGQNLPDYMPVVIGIRVVINLRISEQLEYGLRKWLREIIDGRD